MVVKQLTGSSVQPAKDSARKLVLSKKQDFEFNW
jgi:hypothetical protein